MRWQEADLYPGKRDWIQEQNSVINNLCKGMLWVGRYFYYLHGDYFIMTLHENLYIFKTRLCAKTIICAVYCVWIIPQFSSEVSYSDILIIKVRYNEQWKTRLTSDLPWPYFPLFSKWIYEINWQTFKVCKHPKLTDSMKSSLKE